MKLMKQGSPFRAIFQTLLPMKEAMAFLWAAGGIRSLWAGEKTTSQCYDADIICEWQD